MATTVPQHMLQWAAAKFPQPCVAPEWLEDCYNWIVDEHQFDPNINAHEIQSLIEEQILLSDLGASMLRGTGLVLPRNFNEQPILQLPAQGVLMQIVSLTEVGHSALSLQNIRETRINREAMDEDAARIAEEDEGPLSDYPRSMLKMELSDGLTTIQAIEYKKLPELALGKTPLGYKMVVKNAKMRRGIAFLQPENVVMRGQWAADLEQHRDHVLNRSLLVRLGKPDPGPPTAPDPSQGPPDATAYLDLSQTAAAATNAPAPRRANPPPPPRTNNANPDYDGMSDLDDDPEDDLIPGRGTNMTGPTAVPTQTNAGWNSDAESDFGIVDDDFFAKLDEAEQVAMSQEPSLSQQPATRVPASSTVIDIDDSMEIKAEDVGVARTRRTTRKTTTRAGDQDSDDVICISD